MYFNTDSNHHWHRLGILQEPHVGGCASIMATVIENGLILSMRAGAEPEIGSILIGDDGRIVAVGAEVSPPPGAVIIDAERCIVMPGMIDAHRHSWLSSTRTSASGWTSYNFLKHIRGKAMQDYRPKDLYISALVGMLDALEGGVTTVLDYAHCLNSPEHVDANMEALEHSGGRAVYGIGFNEVPGKRGGFRSLEERFDNLRNMVAKGSSNELVTLWTSASDLPFEGAQTLVEQVRASRALGVPITLHGCVVQLPNLPTEVEALNAEGLLGPDILWAHMGLATDEELKLVLDSGGKIVSLPAAEMLGAFIPPVIARWSALGGRPAIGVTMVTGAPRDLFTTMFAGMVSYRLDHPDTVPDDPGTFEVGMREAVEWATINGADAVGLADRIGSLEPGKDADIIILRPGLVAEPVINPWGTVVSQLGTGNVDTVLVKGKVVKRDGKLLADTSRIATDFRSTMDHLAHANPVLRGPWVTGSGCGCNECSS